MSINANYLVHTEGQIVFQVSNPPCKSIPNSGKEIRGGKIDWVEAFNIIKNGTQRNNHKNMEIEISWAAQYGKIVTLRNELLSIFSKIAPEELENSSKFVSLFLEISNPEMKEVLNEVSAIFAKTVPLTNENIAKATYLYSEEKILNLYENVRAERNVKYYGKTCTSMRDIDNERLNPIRKSFKKNNPKSEALASTIFKKYCEIHNFKESEWNPSWSMNGLIKELENHGPLLVSGNFGREFYSKPPFQLKAKIGDAPVWGWEPQDTLYHETFSNSKWLGEEGHKVVIIGAQRSSNYVYFVDPLDSPDDQKIYVMSLGGLRKRIRDLWNDVLLELSQISSVATINIKGYALYWEERTIALKNSTGSVLKNDNHKIEFVMDEGYKNSNTAHFLSLLNNGSTIHGFTETDKNSTRNTNHLEKLVFNSSQYSMWTNSDTKKLLKAIETESSNSHVSSKEQKERLASLWKIFDDGLMGPDHMGGNPLQGAAFADDLETFKRILQRAEKLGNGKKEALLNSVEPKYNACLMHIAVEGKAKSVLKYLVEIAPELKSRVNLYNATPLSLAKKYGYEMLSDLLK
ncbi:MAG: hypothetical protein H0T62_11000 [Parachlamydiaceae bacterium]|nr:hypothetical protein [Parachlamydiaceae bacterium]